MSFFQNQMSRNGGVRDALAKLKTRHNAIIERRKKERENAMAGNKVEPATVNKASTLAGPASPVNEIGRNSVAELDSVCTKSPSKNPTKMASVAEWLLWGEEESPRSARASSRSPPRTPQQALATPRPISESHSFDNSQFSSHFYSEFTDDYTVDDSLADVTLASSKEPGLFTHGLIAVGELFTGQAVTPPRQKRSHAYSRSEFFDRKSALIEDSDEEDDDDDETVQPNDKNGKDDSSSLTTATTASSSPSGFMGDANYVNVPSARWRGLRSSTPIKYHNLNHVNINDSCETEVEMSLEQVVRMEI